MKLNFSLALRNARLQTVIDTIDGGDDSATPTAIMQFYTGPKPAAAGAAIGTEVLLASCVLPQPSATIVNGVLTFEPIADDEAADATGVIAWCRIVDSSGVWVMDLDCGVDGLGAAIIFNTLNVQGGGVLKIISGSFTEGNI